jgi:signal transduction histidine kinase
VQKIAGTAVEAERHRLARELHDSVTQRLYSAAFLAEALPRLVDHDRDTSIDAAERIRSIVLSSLAELRSLLFELRPLELDAATIDELLRRLVENVTESTGAEIELFAQSGPPLPADVKLGLYRIAQEALSNAVRHSGAHNVRVTQTWFGDTIRLEVHDNGRGFSVDDRDDGHGLQSISERARLLDAELVFTSGPEEGTTLLVAWPRGYATDAGVTPTMASSTARVVLR